MRKALLSIAAVTFLASGASAQITLADTSFNNPVNTTDSLIYSIDGYNTNAGNMVNQAYTNHTWDLISNNFVLGSNANPRWKVISYTPATGYTYSANWVDTLNHRTVGSSSIPVFTYNSGTLTTIASGGILESGRAIQAAAYDISSLPGASANDSIKILAQNSMYYQTTIGNIPTQRKKIEFPATMSDMWNNLFKDTIKGLISYGTTYSNDTLQIKEVVSETATVVGWGKMKINLPTEYGGGQSAYFNVLQVRVYYQVTDSFLVEGDTIPNAVLANLGVTQGQVRRFYYDEYYRPDYVVPFALIRHTDANRNVLVNNRHLFHPQHFNPTSISQFQAETGFAIYPNPVKSNKIGLTINQVNGKNNWSYNVININGQTIATNEFAVNGNKAEVSLPHDMPSGIYYITITDGERKMTKSLIIE